MEPIETYVKVERSDCPGQHYITELKDAYNELSTLDESEVGSKITFTLVEMLVRDFEELEEFSGW